MAGVAAIRQDVEAYDLMYIADVPVAFVPANATVMLERAVEDALGVESGANVRLAAARDAAREIVMGAAARIGVTDGARRVQLARSLFSAFGEGRLSFELAGEQRRGIGQSLLHGSEGPGTAGFAPGEHAVCDAYAGGWIAAAIELVANRDVNTVGARETTSPAWGHERSEFELVRGDGSAPRATPSRDLLDNRRGPTSAGEFGARIASIAESVRDAIDGERVGEDGRMYAFGVPVSVRPATYGARIAFQTATALAAAAPDVLPAWHALHHEIGVRWVVDGFGQMLRADAFAAVAGSRAADPEEVVVQCCALARATGLGRWTVAEYHPDRALVIEVPATHESALWHGWNGASPSPREHLLQGMITGVMLLASSTELGRRSFVQDPTVLAGLPLERHRWKVAQPQCLSCGHDVTRIEVTAAV